MVSRSASASPQIVGIGEESSLSPLPLGGGGGAAPESVAGSAGVGHDAHAE